MQPQQTTLSHRTASTITVATADQKASKANTTSLSSSAASVRSITPATPVTPIIPSPTAGASASASASALAEDQHMSVRDFNGGEVREWLRRGTTTTITPVSTSAPSAVKPTSPAWASKPSITAAGQDFWMLIRRQMYMLESVGGSGGNSGNSGNSISSTNK